jgi:DNA-directed RNA polymerase III subunit RPC8
MFQLSIIKDTLSVHPAHFGVPPDEALIAEINKKYANRVVHDLGLCVCLFDLVQAGEGKVRYGDGCLWYKGAFRVFLFDVCTNGKYAVVFRMVVFRPFTSEVVVAKVKSSDEDGIRCTSLFFLSIDRLLPYRIQ